MTTGYKTATTRKVLSAPMKWLSENGHLTGNVLDYGCGKGNDANILSLVKYDPYYFPVRTMGKAVFYSTITCQYVLNVIVDQVERDRVLSAIQDNLKGNGLGYITVRRDLPKQGKMGKGCFQSYVMLDLPIVKETSSYCIYLLKS